MIRLNRTTEYGLIALRHIARKQAVPGSAPELSSAREIADRYGLPFEITAKTLQRLKEVGLIQSTQGARGGYLLNRSIESANLGQFIEWMEGNSAIVCCVESRHAGCEYQVKCDIQHIMSDLNGKISGFLSSIRLLDFVLKQSTTPREEDSVYVAQ
jgi:Rrf2 family protein